MQEVEFFCIWRNKVIDETEMFGKNACVVVLCNFMGDNKLLSEFVIILSQMKSCDCKTCKLKVDL